MNLDHQAYRPKDSKIVNRVMSKKRFGMLTVLELADPGDMRKTTYKPRLWLCKCDCGKIVTVRDSVLFQRTKYPETVPNCGDHHNFEKGKDSPNYKHGLSHDRLYRIWYAMIRRCYITSDKGYATYGGKGVYVCDEWYTPDNPLEGLRVFRLWAINNGYRDDLTLDRYPKRHGPYSPDNCRWVDMSAQNNNKDSVKQIRYNDKYHSLQELRDDTGITCNFLYNRLHQGWDYPAIIYSWFHRSLLLRRKGSRYIDIDGFERMIPSNPRFIPRSYRCPAKFINLKGEVEPIDQHTTMQGKYGLVIPDSDDMEGAK